MLLISNNIVKFYKQIIFSATMKDLSLRLAEIAGNAQIMTLADNLDIFSQTPAKFRSIYASNRINVDFLISIGTINAGPNTDVFLDPSYLK